jgi:release factor glutamine methyltransferase
MLINQAVTHGAAMLPGTDEGDKRRTARLLLAHILGLDQAHLLTSWEHPLGTKEFQQFERLVSRRASGEPLQYILGRQEFYGLEFEVNPSVLIPRPETEFLVEQVLRLCGGGWPRLGTPGTPGTPGPPGTARVWRASSAAHPSNSPGTGLSPASSGPAGLTERSGLQDDFVTGPIIVDLGTGSGCIAVALATKLPGARIIATDISARALEVARLNAQKNGVGIELVEGDLFEPLATLGLRRSVDIIASNPPYISHLERETLQKEVRDFEPELALYAGLDGLDFYRWLLAEGGDYLKPGGYLAFEIGFGQLDDIRRLLIGRPWRVSEVVPDLQQIPRVLTLQWNGPL